MLKIVHRLTQINADEFIGQFHYEKILDNLIEPLRLCAFA